MSRFLTSDFRTPLVDGHGNVTPEWQKKLAGTSVLEPGESALKPGEIALKTSGQNVLDADIRLRANFIRPDGAGISATFGNSFNRFYSNAHQFFNAAGNQGLVTIRPFGAVAGLNVALPIYANNAAAIGAGLGAGDLYRTGGDPDHVCIVH